MITSVQIIGLGRMGKGVGARLASSTEVFGFDLDENNRSAATQKGIQRCESLQQLLETGKPGSRLFWLMVPAGSSVDKVLDSLSSSLVRGDVVLDGGNSNFKDSIRRGKRLAEMGVDYLDAGVSGGIKGESDGYCLMVGGKQESYERVAPLLARVATEKGCAHVGPSGSGHFVKMVHNAIEYGILQVIGEGFGLLNAADHPVDLGRVAELWNHGSVIRSWLMELSAEVLKNPEFGSLSDRIGGGETGTWAVQEALDRKIPMPLITQSLIERFESSSDEIFGHKLIAGLRKAFGGHEVSLK